MKNEIEKVLTMVQEGKIDAAKASELIYLLNERESGNTTKTSKATKYTDKILRIRIVSEEDGNVSVNLPIKLIKVLLSAGMNIAASIPESEKYVKNIDLNVILEAIDNELDGEIIDVKSSNGEIVSITIE
ncbi:hypothetical protein OEV98_12840 [Caldibacillus lycopersici]|uniref:YvlB/LiaX N-terminal domain-containing protein n=1 Tax=Perspicuibacillus lycopersici TaxID=1325689 RepID=A0AAE3LRA9_9BACI|nr:hypothetical protein [Perspicuibacillus lycopersici]MCU9614424.1 hypothetical protein [Perspicuibacillus lycopersici]